MIPLVTTLKALADRNRLRAVLAIDAAGELCACQVTELLGVRGATASRHLGQLVRAGVVTSRQDGRWIHFRLSPAFARSEPLAWLRRAARRDRDLAADRHALAAILAEDPVDVCRRQRGDTCCPTPKGRP